MRTTKRVRFGVMMNYFATIVFLLLTLTIASQAATIRIPRTGQTTCYNEVGVVIACAGTGQDGEKQAGATAPSPRFTDNKNGTVTDNLTGLIWLKDGNCTDTAGGIVRSTGLLNWPSALTWCNNLASGKCGLSDNSVAGDWRLPNVNEMRSLVDYSRHDPVLPSGHPFINAQSVWYWTSTSNPVYTAGAFNVGISRGSVHSSLKVRTNIGISRVGNKSSDLLGVWAVRGGLVPGRPSGATAPSAP